jgi:hypothetical protein
MDRFHTGNETLAAVALWVAYRAAAPCWLGSLGYASSKDTRPIESLVELPHLV